MPSSSIFARRVGGIAASLTVLFAGHTAQAGGFNLREQSSYYQGTSYAGYATSGGAGLASMYWNPAAVNFTPGLSVEQNFSLVMPHASIDVYRATNAFGSNLGNLGVGNITKSGLLPSGYAAYGWDNMVMGLSLNSPYGLVTKANCNWAGAYYGCKSSIFDVNGQVSLAYKVNDWLVLGGSVNINYFHAHLDNAQILGVSAAGPTIGSAQVIGDSLGVGFGLGAVFTLAPGTTVGVGYRSAVKQSLDGDLNLLFMNNQFAQRSARADITLPDQISASFRSQLDEKWTVLGSLEWTNWSVLKQLEIMSEGKPASLLDLEWKDGWFFSAGVEYLWDANLALRAGVAYELTPVPDKTRSPRMPDTNRTWFSAGATYWFSPQFSADLGYSFILGEKSPIDQYQLAPGNMSRGNLIGEVNNGYVHIVSAGLRYRFDSSGLVQPELITK
ncbi:OmpP1/FadL family transporter [Xanthobacter sp. TB0136]|uniref:OmpP1/FadL family transporter n=1 Tax=Xanthobacter sp. TB0136 TaxID=3459177 RepID=UPI004038FB58